MVDIQGSIEKLVDKALAVHRPLVLKQIQRARRSRPDAAPHEIVQSLDKQFLAAVVAMGTAAGGSSSVPGNPASVAINLLEVGTYLEASVLYVLALAEIHDLRVDDLERRRTLLYGILFGRWGC